MLLERALGTTHRRGSGRKAQDSVERVGFVERSVNTKVSDDVACELVSPYNIC
jgi:hypothetical protein